MATNPMQKKTRNAFILGMVVMLLIAAIIVTILYMKIRNQQEQINNYQQSTKTVWVLNQDVKSGQVLTPSMFVQKPASTTVIPAGATGDIVTTLSSYSLSDNEGRAIYFHPASANNKESVGYYYYLINNKEYRIRTEINGQEVDASYLAPGDKAYFYLGEAGQQKTNVTIAENAVVAKVDMNANTIITGSLISRADEITTKDLRKEEYNVISLPVDLNPGEYVDVRLILPNGQNYIVVSKKKVTIPVVNGEYLADTIQMNLTEEEILTLSCAIVENYKINGSKLYATRYTEAGIQEAAFRTYKPNNYVINLIKKDSNIVSEAKQAIAERNNSDIDKELSSNGTDENVTTKTEESVKTTQEARKNYLQTLPAIQ